MTTYAHLLTEHFDIWTAATATKSAAGRGSNRNIELYGLKKLRELILELAVRGLLVPQDPRDEPASVLLKKIAAERVLLIKNKIINPKKLADIKNDDLPFELPEKWAVGRLGNLSHVITKGTTPTSIGFSFTESGISFIKIENLDRGRIDKKSINQYISEETNKALARSQLQEGDLLFSIAGTIGKTCIVHDVDLPANTNQALAIIRGTQTVYTPEYLRIQLDSFVAEKTRAKARGGAMPNISLGDLSELVLPIPPLAEQRRIVAKVDELMALCDQLEQRHEASVSAHHTLTRVLLAALTNARDPGQFADAWARIADHFDAIFTTADSIVELKQTILQLAVMGKLVRQNPADEPASVLLKRIAAEKAKLVKAGKIKKQEQFPPIREDEQPFELPEGWEWTRLGSIAEIGPRNVLDDDTEVAFVPMPLISTSYKGEHGQETKKWGEIKKGYTHFRNGDIALAKITPCFENSKAAIFKDLVGGYGAGTTELHIARPIGTTMSPFYILLYLKSPMFLAVGKTKMTGSAGQKRVPNSFFSENPLPFPPLAEQHRIVAKVDELMALCDRMHERITASRATQQQLADALTTQAVGGETACFHANAFPS